MAERCHNNKISETSHCWVEIDYVPLVYGSPKSADKNILVLNQVNIIKD